MKIKLSYGCDGYVLLKEVFWEGRVIKKKMGKTEVIQQDEHVGKR